VDFAQLVKIYAASQVETRYSPAECMGYESHAVTGNPDPRRASTSYVERANLFIRMGLRQYTQFTNSHSKKLENYCAALAIYFMQLRPPALDHPELARDGGRGDPAPVERRGDRQPSAGRGAKKRGPYKPRISK
jgi:hypothetical protein